MRTHYLFLHRGALSLNQDDVNKTNNLSNEIFDASSCLQMMKINNVIKNRLQIM